MITSGIPGSPTKKGEYHRTMEMLENITGATEENLIRALWFLYDSSYNGAELKQIADTAYESRKLRGKQ